MDGQAAGGPGPEHFDGETSVQQAGQKHGLTAAELADWLERCLLATENGLRARPRDEHSKKLRQKVGEFVLGVDIPRAVATHRPVPGEPLER